MSHALPLRRAVIAAALIGLLGLCAFGQSSAQTRNVPYPAAQAAGAGAPIEYVNGFGGWFGGMAQSGSYLFQAEGSGVIVVDVSNIDAPTRVARLPLPGRGRDVQLVNGRLYVNLAYGLAIADVSQPTAPVLLGLYTSTDGDIFSMSIAGTHAYVTTTGVYDSVSQLNIHKNLNVLDVGNPAAVTKVGSYEFSDGVGGIVVAAGRAYVAHGGANSNGLDIFDITNSAQPQLLANHIESDQASVIVRQVVGNIAYVVVFHGAVGTLELVDISNPASWNVRGSIDLDNAYYVSVVGTRAYVIGNGIDIVDVTTITKPVLLGSFQSPTVISYQIAGNTAYIGLTHSQIQVLDLTDPGSIVTHGKYLTTSGYFHFAISGNRLYGLEVLHTMGNFLSIYDISDPTRVSLVGRLDGIVGDSIAVAGNYAYVADGIGATGGSGLQIVDVADPTKPVLRGHFPFDAFGFTAIAISGQFVYLYTFGDLLVVDVSDPSNPVQISSVKIAAGQVSGLHVLDGRLYVSSDLAAYIIDIQNPRAPKQIGKYAAELFGQYSARITGAVPDRNLLYISSALPATAPPNEAGQLEIVDVADPLHPMLLSKYPVSLPLVDLSIQDSLVYLASADARSGGVEIIDVSDPAVPARLASRADIGPSGQITVQADLIYVSGRGDGVSTSILRAAPAKLLQSTTAIDASGGTLEGAGGHVHVAFPAGAVAGPTTVRYQGLPQLQQLPPPSGLSLVRAFTLTATDAGGNPVTHFAKPYMLTIDYSDAELAAAHGGVAGLNVAFWDGGAWRLLLPCDGCSVDTVNHRVTVLLDHFTQFALVGSSAGNLTPGLYLPLIQR